MNWTGDVADPNAASTTVIMDGDKTVTANFSEEGPPDDVSHVSHFTDPRGPGLGEDCSVCHTGTPESAGNVDLSACNTCHSPGGAYDGVKDPDIGCIANWGYGICEADGSLKPAKDAWCATCHDNGSAYSQPVEPDAPAAPVFMNNDDATYYDSPWPLVSGNPEAFEGDFQYDDTPGDGDTATWTPVVPESGHYKVYTWWTAWTNRATDAPYTITYNGGSETVDVNQQILGGQWNELGTYPFAVGTSGTIELSDDADGMVVADGVKLELQP